MKGVDEVFSETFALFILIIVIMLVGAVLLIATNIFILSSSFGFIGPRESAVNVFFKPVSYQSNLLAFLEMEREGIPMKRILNAVAIQGTTNVWLPEADKFIDVSKATEEMLGQTLLGGKIYLLKIRDPEIVIASRGKATNWQKVSTELFVLDGKPVDLELYVG